MEKIAQANIDRFSRLLTTELDPTKRAMIIRLLKEEEDRLRQLAGSNKTDTKA